MAAFNTEVAVDQLTEKGVAQGLRPTSQILASSFLGGAMLGWGGLLMTVVGGGCADLVAPGAVALLKGAVFPVGLSMITLSGSELFTGNMLTQALPPVGEERLHPAARVLGWSFVGNFAGSLVPIFNISSAIFMRFLEGSENDKKLPGGSRDGLGWRDLPRERSGRRDSRRSSRRKNLARTDGGVRQRGWCELARCDSDCAGASRTHRLVHKHPPSCLWFLGRF